MIEYGTWFVRIVKINFDGTGSRNRNKQGEGGICVGCSLGPTGIFIPYYTGCK
jgi:hypothetical protein